MPSSEENFVKHRPQTPSINKREIGDAAIRGERRIHTFSSYHPHPLTRAICQWARSLDWRQAVDVAHSGLLLLGHSPQTAVGPPTVPTPYTKTGGRPAQTRWAPRVLSATLCLGRSPGRLHLGHSVVPGGISIGHSCVWPL